jgi:hypothetical protein
MFGQNLPEAEIEKKKTDLFIRATIRVHLVQYTTEDDISPDDADSGDYEENRAGYDASKVRVYSKYGTCLVNALSVKVNMRNAASTPQRIV